MFSPSRSMRGVGKSNRTWDECFNLYRNRALEEALRSVYNVPCQDTFGDVVVTRNDLVHLRDCPVSGQMQFTSSWTGLEELIEFKDNLPSNMTGAAFYVDVEYNSRRRGGWSSAESVSNVRSTSAFAFRVHIGDYGADRISGEIPSVSVPVTTAADFQREDTGWFGSAPGHLSSKNMEASEDGTFLYATDVRVYFFIANATSVSVLSSMNASKHLVPWQPQYPGLGGNGINTVVVGSSGSEEMINTVGGGYHWGENWYRFVDVGIVWVGTFCVIWPAYAFDICVYIGRRGGDRLPRYSCKDIGLKLLWAFLWGLVPTGFAFFLSWFGHRYVVVFFIAAGVLVPVFFCASVGLCNSFAARLCPKHETDESSQDEEEDCEEIDEGDAYEIQIAGVLALSALVVPLVITVWIHVVYMHTPDARMPQQPSMV